MVLDVPTQNRIEKCLRRKIVGSTKVFGGYTPAERWRIVFSAGDSAFVKIGVTEDTRQWLRNEAHNYKVLKGHFLPEVLAWDDHEEKPILILEDLGKNHWPPPWEDKHIEAVVTSLQELHSFSAPVRSFKEVFPNLQGHWRAVEANPKPFLDLNLVSEKWLDKSLPLLIEVESSCETAGTAVTPLRGALYFHKSSENLKKSHNILQICVKNCILVYVESLWSRQS